MVQMGSVAFLAYGQLPAVLETVTLPFAICSPVWPFALQAGT